MNIHDMKKGKFYTVSFKNGEEFILLFLDLDDEEEEILYEHAISPDEEYYDYSSSVGDRCDVREATPSEIAHLQACIEEEEYVSAPEIDNYEIY